MRFLVDTHAFLWYAAGDRRLSEGATRTLEEEPEEWCLSAASVWEMSIKASMKRLVLPAPTREYIAEKIAQGLHVLQVEWSHAAAVELLPFHHRDPFDRLIIAQASTERLTVVTGDPAFSQYDVRLLW